jgi:hypothetical protein
MIDKRVMEPRLFHVCLFTGLPIDANDSCISRSQTPASSEQSFEDRMCAHISAMENRSRMVRVLFNDTEVWEDCVSELSSHIYANPTTSPSKLDQFLQRPSVEAQSQPTPAKRANLNLVSRKIVGLSVAYSLFQLCSSPWLQQTFEGDNIYLLPNGKLGSRLDYWRPHISCQLDPPGASRSIAEDVAALGVLILELEANRSAGWTDDDEDYDTMAARSNKTRLARIMKEWKGNFPDVYHSVASACFRFDNLVEDFDHPKIDQGLKGLAILYKCIVNPLFQKLVSDFWEAESLFQRIPGLSVPTAQKRSSTTGNLVLYDDLESAEPDKK